MRARDIARELQKKWKEQSVRAALLRLRDNKTLVQPGWGQYALSPTMPGRARGYLDKEIIDRLLAASAIIPSSLLIVIDSDLVAQHIDGDMGLLAMHGYDRGDLLYRSLADALNDHDRQYMMPYVKGALGGGSFTVIRRVAGMYLVWIILPVADGDERHCCAVCLQSAGIIEIQSEVARRNPR